MKLKDRFPFLRGTAAEEDPAPTPADRREAPRYAADCLVSVRRWGGPAVHGRLVNISRAGAAIRLDGGTEKARPLALQRLTPGSDVQVAGLLDEPVWSWVIGREQTLLRVRFAQDETTRGLLRDLIRDWFGAEE